MNGGGIVRDKFLQNAMEISRPEFDVRNEKAAK